MHHAPVLRSERQAAPDEAPASPPLSIIPLTASRRRRAFLRRLGAMNPAERARAARNGELSYAERALWAARYPSEVPLVNDELPWIALGLVADND